ncbi:MAG: EAL domain-containing protein [Gammaproteobacteria bacterium]|nr:EAL domain-containing protein [Gammaproteobacteria bacterium]
MATQASLERRARRERLARKEAERLLENKSRELFYSNQTLAEREAKTRMVLHAVSDGILTYCEDGIIQSCNPAAESLFGCVEEQLIGQLITPLFHTDTILVPPKNHDLQQIRQTHIKKFNGSSCPVDINIGVVTLESGRVYIATIRDITERTEAQKRINRLAYYDALTGLANRTLFQDRLEQALENARRYEHLVALLFLDLDRFKRVNDTLGHGVGDQFLIQIAKRLRNTVRSSDSILHFHENDPLLTRLGGDEFTLLLPHIHKANDVARVGQRILNDLRRPVCIEGHELVLTGSIGIALYPEDGDAAETLLRNADVAMYQAKKRGKNKAIFYSSSMNKTTLRVLNFEEELRRALQEEQFEIYFQPKISVKSKKLVGAEALIRWHHPEHGLVFPGDFLPVAEETGLIGPISNWVMAESCRQIRGWQESGKKVVSVSVNVSNQQFDGNELLAIVQQTLSETGIEPALLELELTETIVMENAQLAIELTNQLKQQGVALSIDDFGTGYSSMSHLKRLSVDKLKIDRSFIKDLGCAPEDEAIVQAITALAHSLNLKVTVEGVETEQQLKFLGRCGCEEAQGFLFSKAIPADQFVQWLE